MFRPIRSAATLQQTKTRRKTSEGALIKLGFAAMLRRWAQRERQLPEGQVSLRSDNFATRRFLNPHANSSMRPMDSILIGPAQNPIAIRTSRKSPATPRFWTGQRPSPTVAPLSEVVILGKHVLVTVCEDAFVPVPPHETGALIVPVLGVIVTEPEPVPAKVRLQFRASVNVSSMRKDAFHVRRS